jgi:TonB family protein
MSLYGQSGPQLVWRRAVKVAVVLHLLLLVTALVLRWLAARAEPTEPVVFELVAAAAPRPAVEAPAEEPAEDLSVEPSQAAELPPLPELRPLPALPPPQQPPVTQPPPPAAEPEREIIDIREFRRDRPAPSRSRTVVPANRPAPEVAPIETRLRERLERRLAPIRIEGVDLSDLPEPDALQGYLVALRERIERAFEPSGSGLSAEASFAVDAAGRISSVRLVRASGDPVFDEQVRRTLASVATPGPPPGNRAYAFSLVFRSE